MKKTIALLLTGMLLISAIQPVCAAQTTECIEAAIPQDTDNLSSSSEQKPQISQSSEQSEQDNGQIVSPDQAKKSAVPQADDATFNFDTNQEFLTLHYNLDPQATESNRQIYYTCNNPTNSTITLSVSSSNTKVLKIVSDNKITLEPGALRIFQKMEIIPVGVGYTDIIVSTGKTSYKMHCYVVPYGFNISQLTQPDFRHIKLKWKKVPGCSGYYVQRSTTPEGGYKTIKTLSADKSSLTLSAEWNVPYFYRIIGYVKDNARTVTSDNDRYHPYKKFIARKIAGSTITSVKKSGSNNLVIKWNAFKGATGYKLYRSTQENGSYKCIYTAKSSKTTSYKQKVSTGVPYYYKLITLDAKGKSGFSPSVSQIIPTNNKIKSISCNKINQRTSNGFGQYSSHWSHPDTTYYYQSNGKFYAVCVQNNGNLNIYTLNSSYKVTKTKTVKLKYDTWGGFYQGTDGNFYVAVGYQNPQESKTKTVIKVIQYNSKWKKLKTASINGGVKNSFEGIYSPFNAGNCRMDMKGSTLYLMTSRQMFMTSDGARHQSNISFKINTKKMEAVEANESYASHSFNQFAKFKDDALYLLDHGDAYPRSLKLTTVANYGADNQTVNSSSLFSFQGEIGSNFTGCKVGGMEIGNSNVLVCGTSQPHNKKIKNISGSGNDLKYNAFLVISNRKSGKVTLQWLTNYNPKTTSVIVGETRMVKLTDKRFVILYSTTQKGKSTLNYAVYSDTGKKIYSKKYANMVFDGDSQPILNNGSIVWISTTESNGKKNTKLYSIPAKF